MTAGLLAATSPSDAATSGASSGPSEEEISFPGQEPYAQPDETWFTWKSCVALIAILFAGGAVARVVLARQRARRDKLQRIEDYSAFDDHFSEMDLRRAVINASVEIVEYLAGNFDAAPEPYVSKVLFKSLRRSSGRVPACRIEGGRIVGWRQENGYDIVHADVESIIRESGEAATFRVLLSRASGETSRDRTADDLFGFTIFGFDIK